MTIFNITKNVQEEFNLILSSDFKSTPYAARIDDSISMVVARPIFSIGRNVSINSTIGMTVSSTSSVGSEEPSSGTYTTLETNCEMYENGATFWINKSFMGMGSYIDSGLGRRTWLPFVVPLPQGQVVISAILSLVASETRWRNWTNVKMGCDSTDDAVAPTTYNELNMRVSTANVAVFNHVANWNLDVTYTFDVTSPVQEILNRVGWINGNTLALILFNNFSDPNMDREFWCYSNGDAAKRPTLTINI